MPGMPWLKLYVGDILNDATMTSLDDGAKWTFVQLLALAGECDAGGAFVFGGKPMPVNIIAWRLSMDAGILSQRIGDLVRAGKLSMDGENVIIPDFMDKQGPTQADRREEWRKRQAKHRNSQDSDDTDSRGESKNENENKEEEEELRVKSKEEEVEVDVSRVTSHVTEPKQEPTAAATLPDKTLPEYWPSLFMADFFKATGEQANKELAEQAVYKTLEYIKGKNYPVKYEFTWIQERYSLLSMTAQKAKYDYPIPEYDDDVIPDDDDQDDDTESEIPEGVMHIYDIVSATWPEAWRTNMTPIDVTDECITIGVSGQSIDLAQARYGKTLENTFMKPVVFAVMQ